MAFFLINLPSKKKLYGGSEGGTSDETPSFKPIPMMYALQHNPFSFQPKEWIRPTTETIRYFDEGDSNQKALLMVHGLGNNTSVWFKMMDLLKDKFRCIALDLPGHGFSTSHSTVSIDSMSEAVLQLIEHLNLDEVVLIGHSMGGQISTRAALKNSDLFNRLVLLAPAGFEVFSPKEKSWLKSIYATWLLKKLSKQRMMDQFQENFFHFGEDAQFFLKDLQILRDDPEAFLSYCETLSACMSAMLDEPIFDELSDLKLPTTVIYGENDAIIPNPVLHPNENLLDIAQAATQQIPGGILQMIPECGHMLQWEKAREIGDLILT